MKAHYIKTLFSYVELPESIIPCTCEILHYMDEEERTVFLNTTVREEIMELCNIGNSRFRQVLLMLRRAKLIHKTRDKWVFEVSKSLLEESYDLTEYHLKRLSKDAYQLTVWNAQEDRREFVIANAEIQEEVKK